jgi:endonuclease-8
VPEGHTIHRLARDIGADLAGREVAVSSPQGRFAAGAARLDGSKLCDAEAAGKHLFLRWSNGEVLHIHLGLIGKLRSQPSPPAPPVGIIRLRMEGEERTWDLSGPSTCALVDIERVEQVMRSLGPDPLRADAEPERFVERVSRSRTPIGTLLLDQTVIAGIGNVYRAEVLFLHGIHPARPGSSIPPEELRALWETIRAQLRAGVRRNKIVTVPPDELDVPVSKVPKGDGLYVYHQETCRRCGSTLQRLEVAGRRIDVCPRCQPA